MLPRPGRHVAIPWARSPAIFKIFKLSLGPASAAASHGGIVSAARVSIAVTQPRHFLASQCHSDRRRAATGTKATCHVTARGPGSPAMMMPSEFRRPRPRARAAAALGDSCRRGCRGQNQRQITNSHLQYQCRHKKLLILINKDLNFYSCSACRRVVKDKFPLWKNDLCQQSANSARPGEKKAR